MPQRRPGRVVASLVVVAALTSCTATDPEPEPERPTLADAQARTAPDGDELWTDEVVIEDRDYAPADALVGAGRVLRVVNRDAEAHTVTSFDGSFDVEVGPGQTAQFVAPEPGAYPYSCRFHPEMGAELSTS